SAGFAEPHLNLMRRFAHIAPTDRPCRPRAGDIGGHLAVEDRLADASLLRTEPDRRIFSAAALIVALEPLTDLAQAREIHAAAHVSSGVGEEEFLRSSLLHQRVVVLPEKFHAVIEFVPVGWGSRWRQVAADVAITHRQTADRRP